MVTRLEDLLRNKNRTKAEVDSAIAAAMRRWDAIEEKKLLTLLSWHPDMFRVTVRVSTTETENFIVAHQVLVHDDPARDVQVIDIFCVGCNGAEFTVTQVFLADELLFARKVDGWLTYVSAKDILRQMHRVLSGASA